MSTSTISKGQSTRIGAIKDTFSEIFRQLDHLKELIRQEQNLEQLMTKGPLDRLTRYIDTITPGLHSLKEHIDSLPVNYDMIANDVLSLLFTTENYCISIKDDLDRLAENAPDCPCNCNCDDCNYDDCSCDERNCDDCIYIKRFLNIVDHCQVIVQPLVCWLRGLKQIMPKKTLIKLPKLPNKGNFPQLSIEISAAISIETLIALTSFVLVLYVCFVF